jgi:hypothetical protein
MNTAHGGREHGAGEDGEKVLHCLHCFHCGICRGTAGTLGPGLLVTPPKGLEAGYVPIVTRQARQTDN